MADTNSISRFAENPLSRPGLKKIPPYWYPYRTMAKGRWFDREILEMVSTEFRDRSAEYYRYALASGVTTVNGKIAKPGTIIRNGDRIENIVHRHEPPVTSTPVKILLHDKDRDFVVIDKPGSIPVHATGRYFKNSLAEILKDDFGFKNVHTVNRLDRLTSGLMIIALSPDRARTLTEEFTAGTIRKEYIARVKGRFPSEQITCDQPLLTVDRQMGLNIVHPEGKPATTIFESMHYDSHTDTSVVRCRPLTGRSHQIRVHLQFLGYPIANDPVYSDEKIWGPKLGNGGIDLTPSDERVAPVPPSELSDSTAEGGHRLAALHATTQASISTLTSSCIPVLAPPLLIQPLSPKAKKSAKNPAWRTKQESLAIRAERAACEKAADAGAGGPKLLPRETGHDIGMGSPVPLSTEAVGIITRLRNQKDEDEDWSRWRDVIFRAKAALNPKHIAAPTLPPQSRLQRGGRDDDSVIADDPPESHPDEELGTSQNSIDLETARVEGVPNSVSTSVLVTTEVEGPSVADSVKSSNVRAEVTDTAANTSSPSKEDETLYCPECYVPLHPDPKPEKLYIFLHALRYTTSFGSFETSMPEWAAPNWEWER